MNIMRKLWVTNSGGGQSENTSLSLACMHLRKLYGEYTHSKVESSLYNMLPLFCKLFNNLSYVELQERFPESSHFISSISRLLVLELRKRANNSPTSEAAIAIIRYLEPEQDNEANGFMLINTINLLSTTDDSVMLVMCDNNVPSTLVKALYLFFDLPVLQESHINVIQKVFVQTLIRLCTFPGVCEELAKKDDLALLFSCVSSWCSPNNKLWRKSAADVLMSISTHGITPLVLSYIHNKSCVSLCVDNLRRGGAVSNTEAHLSVHEITEIVFTLFCFLKDSASISQVLLDDFKVCQGYVFLQDLIVSLDEHENGHDDIKNVLLVITSLTSCGVSVLKPNPQNMATPFEEYKIVQEGKSSSTIRNMHAFNLLPNLFSRVTHSHAVILDSISNIFRADKQNYFIVDSFLPQMAEKITNKNVHTQVKYLEIIEYIVFELNFTPCKELIALSKILKQEHTTQSSVFYRLLIINNLLKILKHSPVFKDVYREIGLLEVSIYVISADESPDFQTHNLELISLCISSNNQNLAIFREHSVIVKLISMLPTHSIITSILTTCFTSSGGEEEFTNALVALNKQPNTRVELLTLFINTFKESHRARCNFRKAGGFIYLMSVIVAFENQFNDDTINVNDINVIQLIFNSFALACRFEPANAKLFHHEICVPSLSDTLRLLGVFSKTRTLTSAYSLKMLESVNSEYRINEYHRIFTSNVLSSDVIPNSLITIIKVYRMLYELALDNFDRPVKRQTDNFSPKALNFSVCDAIVHSGVVLVMITLIPSITHEKAVEASLCQLYCAELVKSLVRSDKNQQIMANVGICSEILDKLGDAINDENSILHSPLQYIFERVGNHALTSAELRKFLRLGNPLNCNKDRFGDMESQIAASSQPVCLSRIKTLVSMTTPRSSTNASTLSGIVSPSFVELDMSAEGFGCLFIPSLGSNVCYSQDIIAQSSLLLGTGIGSSNSSTLAYSTWFLVDKFSDEDAHPIRLLSIIKESNNVQRISLSILISAKDKSIIVCTKDTPLPPPGVGDWEPEMESNSCSSTIRVWSNELQEGTWTHALISFNSNTVSVYINGRAAHTGKLESPQRSKQSSSYSAFIGTPPMWRKVSCLCWKQGVAHLFEDFVVSPHTAYSIFKLGPSFLGSFQSIKNSQEHDQQSHVAANADGWVIIPEEKLILGVNGLAVSQLTLQKIRKLYSKNDAKGIARQLGLSSHENATPIMMLHNSVAHLMGVVRPIGGICIGYLGVRLFVPNPVYKSVYSIGGMSVLISLLGLSNSGETLYASLKALVCVVKNSSVVVQRHEAQVIAFVLKTKKHLLSMRVLHLVFNLVDKDSGFNELLADLDIWTDEDNCSDLEKALYEHFVSVMNEQKHAYEYFVRSNVFQGLLSRVYVHTHNSLFSVINCMMRHQMVVFGCFVANTLSSSVEKNLDESIIIRNKCLSLLHNNMCVGKAINVQFCDEFIASLGFDFLLLFSEPNLHGSTLILSLRILCLLLNSSVCNKNKFRDATPAAFSFKNNASVYANKSLGNEYACLGLKRDMSSDHDQPFKHVHPIGGWPRLTYLIGTRILDNQPTPNELWLILAACVLSQGVRSSNSNYDELNLDRIWEYVFPLNPTSPSTSLYGKVTLCPDAIISMLTLTRCDIQKNNSPDVSNTITSFLCFLYSNTPEFQCIFTSIDILTALALTIMPMDMDPDNVFDETPQPVLQDIPAKKIILDFIRIIIIDWMNTQGANQRPNANIVVDTVLDAAANISHQDSNIIITDFNTKLLGTLLDHLIASDIERVFTYLNAVCGFINRLVDKIWIENFDRDPNVVLDFIVNIVNASRTRRNVCASTIDCVYSSLNRVLLYVLSRRHEENSWGIVEVLKKLRTIRTTVFSPHNHGQEFFGCLIYVLMQLEQGSPIQIDTHTTWHVPTSTIVHAISVEISNTACRVWEDLYVSKKPIIEELFKTTWTSPEPPHLSTVRDSLYEQAYKFWMSFLSNELSAKKSSVSNNTWEIHQQLQSKIQKVTGGLRSFARSSIKKDNSVDSNIGVIKKHITDYWGDCKKISAHNTKFINTIKDNTKNLDKVKFNDQLHLKRFVHKTLLPRLEAEITRERGIFGNYNINHLQKWMLDTTEGPCRMRKKLIRNDLFYTHYGVGITRLNRSSSTSSPASPKKRVNAPVSRDSFEYNKYNPKVRVFEVMQEQHQDPVTRSPLSSTSSVDNTTPEDVLEETTNSSSSSVLFRLIENSSEKISQIFRVACINGLESVEGLLLFGREHFYLITGFTILTKTREIKDMDDLEPNSYEPILPQQCYGISTKHVTAHDCFKLPFESVKETLKRRYLLQPIALEIFCSDGRNYLLAFPRKIRNVVFTKFTTFCKLDDHGTADAKQSVAGQKRTTNVEERSIFSSLIGETSVTQRWVRGEISNFQYLMHLNTLAGRSYNDLMQYPVFPWVLSNYDTPYLDLNDPKIFRDFSKPMGAQSPGRLVQFVKRFKEWDDPHGETPPYHYGTHYSSAMIVCSYLVRMEPFAQHFLRLQGGHFDLADRMFHSIKEAWTSASKHNMADVKELIPEFFYLPEFLENRNNFELGYKQNGTALNNVILPAWAKNDSREFIRVHRMALECDYVSQHLHEWIDLIFGYKQQGNPAIDSVNVFHHLFYEGNVDIYNIDDPLKKNATIGFINNFGQIPKQLFKRPHPSKKNFNRHSSILDSSVILNALNNPNPSNVIQSVGNFVKPDKIEKLAVFYHAIELLKPSSIIKELKGPVGQIICGDKSVIALEQNKQYINSRLYVSWGFADCSFRIAHLDTDRPFLICELTQFNEWNGEISACTVANSNVLITGHTNSVVSIWELRSNALSNERAISLKKNLYGHEEAITCVCVSSNYNIVLSGSKDRTAIVWDLARETFSVQLMVENPVDAVAINDSSGDLATADASYLRVWSINGDMIACVNTNGYSTIQSSLICVCFSYLNDWDSDNVIVTGSTDGVVRFWSLAFTQKQAHASSDSNESDDTDPDKDQDDSTATARKASLRASKSESNISDDFEVLHEREIAGVFSLPLGAVWKKIINFRGNLTLHTSYDRKDNVEPASITCINIARDHKTVYVGDARGRVYGWSVNDCGGRADHWIQHEAIESCTHCSVKFTITERKHHCRNCGHVFCGKCSSNETEIKRLKITKPVRVCVACYAQLRDQ